MDIREAAAEARAKQKAWEAQQAAEKAEYEQQQLFYRNQQREERVWTDLGVKMTLDPNSDEFEIDGLKFNWADWDRQLQLWGKCPECGEEVWSRPFQGLSCLGFLLEKFVPHGYHYHGDDEDEDVSDYQEPIVEDTTPAQPDDLAQLRTLLRRIIGLDA